MFTQGGPGDAGPRQLAGPLRSLRVCRWEALPGGGGRGHHVPREQRRLSVSGAPRELEVGRRPRWGRSGTRVEAQPARGGRPHPVPSDARIAAGPVVVDTADGASVPPGGGVLPSELPSFAAGPRRPPGTPSAAVWTHARRPAVGSPSGGRTPVLRACPQGREPFHGVPHISECCPRFYAERVGRGRSPGLKGPGG